MTFTKTAAPPWLLAMWKEIDDKTFGKGFDCFAEDAICNLGVADWHGREAIRNNLRQFIDKGFTALHDVVEYWDSPLLKVFHGKVAMNFDDPDIAAGAADDGAFLLHGRKRSDQGQALDRSGRSHRLLVKARDQASVHSTDLNGAPQGAPVVQTFKSSAPCAEQVNAV